MRAYSTLQVSMRARTGVSDVLSAGGLSNTLLSPTCVFKMVPGWPWQRVVELTSEDRGGNEAPLISGDSTSQ